MPRVLACVHFFIPNTWRPGEEVCLYCPEERPVVPIEVIMSWAPPPRVVVPEPEPPPPRRIDWRQRHRAMRG